jgi:endonuclease/exonuclease/phosphatase family metal-dependent hydrolase
MVTPNCLSAPISSGKQDFIHGAFSASGWGLHPRSRNAHVVRLFDYRHSLPITVVHLHGLRDPSSKHDTPARLAQTKALIRLIQSIWRRSERLVVCGDFNVLPGSHMSEALIGLGLTDLVTTRGHSGTRTSLYKKPERFAGYMLVSDNVDVRSFDVVVEPEVSDHCALVLDIQ